MSKSRSPRTDHTHAATRHLPSNQGRLRIIGGQWRGRKLAFPNVTGLRPTGDRVRETLFNWLNPVLPGATCLDLFAGSGALGLEALSRGAGSAVLVELDARAVESLRAHCHTLSANAEVVKTNAIEWLNTTSVDAPFDIVFLDPPFRKAMLNTACQTLEDRKLLANDAHVYIETSIGNIPTVPINWQLKRQQTAGQVEFFLYQKKPDGSS